MEEVKITVMVDDFNGSEVGFIRSYGFAALIEINNKKILFDVGTKVDPLVANLKCHGVSPSSIDAVILSHNHYDHTNGLPGIIKKKSNIPVFIHKEWDKPASYKGFQVSKTNRVIVQKARELKEVTQGLFLTNSYFSPDYGGVYEQACYIKATSSYILLCGCCHPGLNKFLEDRTLLDISQDSPLHILGGMHGFKFSNNEFIKLSPVIRSINLYHCTINTKTFQKQFRDKCFVGKVGKTLIF